MDTNLYTTPMTRRELLRAAAALAGSGVFAPLLSGCAPNDSAGPAAPAAPAAPADALAATRAQMAAAPMEAFDLGNNLVMLSGPGGNVVVLNGPDGKIVVDTFVQPVWAQLQQRLDAMGAAPISRLINTHWHFDHTDNNASFREAGASILAHENTAKRLSESHELLGMHFDPAPAAARPTETFTEMHTLEANGETVELGYIQPAHTDTDIFIRYANANVLHLGDTFFNGMYPFIDATTGGRINGMIAAADRALGMVDSSTKIVPGHGPLADREALARSRDVLVTVRDRVQKLKAGGRTLDEVVAAKPTADLDAVWGQGFMQPNDFVAIVYSTL